MATALVVMLEVGVVVVVIKWAESCTWEEWVVDGVAEMGGGREGKWREVVLS